MTWIRTQNDIDTFKTHNWDKLNKQKKKERKKETSWTIASECYMLRAYKTQCTTQKDKQDNGGKMRIWKSNINSSLYIKILQIFCYILMVMWYMREGMAAKSLKKKESKEIGAGNRFLFSSKESGIVKWMHYSSCQRKKKYIFIFSIWSDGAWGFISE